MAWCMTINIQKAHAKFGSSGSAFNHTPAFCEATYDSSSEQSCPTRRYESKCDWLASNSRVGSCGPCGDPSLCSTSRGCRSSKEGEGLRLQNGPWLHSLGLSQMQQLHAPSLPHMSIVLSLANTKLRPPVQAS
jgi:hypothetical protein